MHVQRHTVDGQQVFAFADAGLAQRIAGVEVPHGSFVELGDLIGTVLAGELAAQQPAALALAAVDPSRGGR